MNLQIRQFKKLSLGLIFNAVLILGISQNTLAQGGPGGGPTASFKGQVSAFDGTTLSIKMKNGEIAKVGIAEKARIFGLNRIKFEDINKGDFIASAGTQQKDGSLHAIEVRVYAAHGPHPREVFRKFKFGADSRMTNATVDAVIGDISKRTFKVTTKEGEKTIFVPKDVPVMRPVPGSTKMLTPGTNISVVARKGKDGKISAFRVSVGLNGLIPPI